MIKDGFRHLWIPSPTESDLRQMRLYRPKLVRMRPAVKNELHTQAMSEGECRRQKLWCAGGLAELKSLMLLPWMHRQREEPLLLLEQLDCSVAALYEAVVEEAKRRTEVQRLMTHPGVSSVSWGWRLS
jgi:transposase